MPWCPKCKLEYREGISICADCGTELTEELESEKNLFLIMSTHDESLAQKFIDFLKYSGVHSGEKLVLEETGEFSVSVDEKDAKEARKLFQGFYITEVTEAAIIPDDLPEDDGASTDYPDDEEEEAEKEEISTEASLRVSSNVYVKREDKYKDLSSTSHIFYGFGILGLVFVGLNMTGVLSIISGAISYSVYSALFAGCILVGYSTQKSAKRAKAQIEAENTLTDKINQWLKDNISEDIFTDITDDSLSDEINYLHRLNHIKKLLLKEFPDLDESYADQLAEDFYED